jgi:hypothetical protein
MYYSLRKNEGVWEGERVTVATTPRQRKLSWKQCSREGIQTDHCNSRRKKMQKTVGVAEAFEALLSNYPVVPVQTP